MERANGNPRLLWRAIALQSCLTKVATRVWTRRLNADGWWKSPCQKGWRSGAGTHNAHRILVNILELSRLDQRQLHIAFLDCRKAYDSVDHKTLQWALRATGFPQKDIQLAVKLFTDQCQVISTARGLTDPIQPRCGVPQGAVESTILFSAYVEPLLRRIYSRHHDGDGYVHEESDIRAICYADDIALVSASPEGLQE